MFTPRFLISLLFPTLLLALAAGCRTLPQPQTDGGMPLMLALKERQSIREYDTAKPLSKETLSNLLWAADGINRPETGKRTAPSAMNSQEVEIYVVLEQGAYRFEPKSHQLEPIAAGDLRAQTGGEEFVKTAPVNLVYVADLDKLTKAPENEKEFYGGVDTGFISQNVYLFCASEGLGTVVRAGFDRAALTKSLGLRPTQKIVLAQTIGYPKAKTPEK
jgi:SagB-type dehydrogenase family enzyme